MKKIICITILILVLGSQVFAQNTNTLDQKISDLSLKVAKELEASKKKIVVVIDFVDLKGNPNDLGRYIANEMISKLFLMKKFKVIERTKINKAISEKKLNLDNGIDEKTAQQLQSFFGADAIVYGTLSDLGKNIKARVLLANSLDAQTFAFVESSFDKDEEVASLLGVPAQITSKENASQTSSEESIPNLTKRKDKKPFGIKDDKNFSIKLWECFKKDSSIVCHIEITNNGEKRTIGIFGTRSRVFDDSGTTFKGTFVKFPQTQGENPQIELINGATAKITIVFGGASGIRNIKELEISGGSSRIGGIHFVFQDVPLSSDYNKEF